MAKLQLILYLTDRLFLIIERLRRVAALSEDQAKEIMETNEVERDSLIDDVVLPR